jgi:hypothetical protein
MNKFRRSSEAKEFVASRVVGQAQREGVPLSEVERKLLYVSAPEISETDAAMCSEFDREVDEIPYEQRITALIRKADRRYRKEDTQEFLRWRAATQLLLQQDQYIAVMIARAHLRPRWDVLKLLSTAILIVCVLMGTIVLLDKLGVEPSTRDASAFWTWVTLLTLAVGYCLIRLMVGKDKFDKALNWIWNRISNSIRSAN